MGVLEAVEHAYTYMDSENAIQDSIARKSAKSCMTSCEGVKLTDQEITVRVVEGGVVHGLVSGVDEDGHSVLDTNISGTGNGVETLDKVGGLSGDVERRPTELVGGDIDIGLIGVVAHKLGLSVEGLEGSMAD
jgi:hypothetical protein